MDWRKRKIERPHSRTILRARQMRREKFWWRRFIFQPLSPPDEIRKSLAQFVQDESEENKWLL